MDEDKFNGDDLIDFLNETVTLPTLQASSVRRLSARTTLELEVRFGCYPGFYGLNCGINCTLDDNRVKFCDENGTKTCKKGWIGEDCDEQTTCSGNQFSCPNGNCISDTWVCDKEQDCPNGEDETDSQCRGRGCAAGQFRCANQQCINETLKCDNVRDCTGGEDEKHCCGAEDFQCYSGLCLPSTARCNGLLECPDKADERNCEGQCSSKLFTCEEGDGGRPECISRDQVCDGTPDCQNGLDESNVTCANEPCSNPDVCEQLCVPSVGGRFRCACTEGYVLNKKDSSSCLVNETSQDPRLIFSTRDSLRAINLRSLAMVTLQDGVIGAVGVAADVGTKTVYFSDIQDSAIKVFEAGKHDKPKVLVGGLHSPAGLAYDWANRNLYWTDTGEDKIQVVHVDSKLVATLISTGLDEPRSIVVDPRNGWMYWTDWGKESVIKKAGMDGSSIMILIQSGLYWPNGIAIDYPTDRIFWVDARFHVIGSCDFDGGKRRNIYTGGDAVAHPYGLAIFEGNLYISDWESQQLHLVPLRNTTHARSITRTFFQAPNDLIPFHPTAHPSAPVRCRQNGGCSGLCLAAPGISTTACL